MASSSLHPDENEPLLSRPPDPSPNMSAPLFSQFNTETFLPSPSNSLHSISPTQDIHLTHLKRLYVSHTLSTLNSRIFEFGSVLWLAHLFPSTLLPASAYALFRAAAAITFSRFIGWAIDALPRLNVMRGSIIAGRLMVLGSCIGFLVLMGVGETSAEEGGGESNWIRVLILGTLVLLACVEKIASVANLVAMERDWVVVMTEGLEEKLRGDVNSQMRRIDLVCKLLGPLGISFIDSLSPIFAVWATLGMNVTSVFPEYWYINQVYIGCPALERRSSPSRSVSFASGQNTLGLTATNRTAIHWKCLSLFRIALASWTCNLHFYMNHRAFLPSISLSLLYLNVLSFSGQMITFLLSIPCGDSTTPAFSPAVIGGLRTVSTLFELSATWVAPRLTRRLGVVRAGIWALSWQMIWLAGGLGWFFYPPNLSHLVMPSILEFNFHPFSDSYQARATVVSASGLITAVVFSRVGLWTFDLCVQLIVQDEVQSSHRGAFSSTETSFQNAFEMVAFALTIVFYKPSHFWAPMVVSVASVFLAGGLYTAFVRKRRGHLFHFEKVRCSCQTEDETMGVRDPENLENNHM